MGETAAEFARRWQEAEDSPDAADLRALRQSQVSYITVMIAQERAEAVEQMRLERDAERARTVVLRQALMDVRRRDRDDLCWCPENPSYSGVHEDNCIEARAALRGGE